MGAQAGGRRPSKKLMVLSGAAIFAVYVAGYARTQAAADQWQTPGALAPVATASAGSGAGTGGGVATPSAGATTQPTAPSSAAAGGGTPGGTPATGATGCTTASAATIAPPPATYRYGDDGRRGRDGDREREREGRRDGARAAVLPATQAPAQCPPATAPSSGQHAAAPAVSGQAAPAQGASTSQGQPHAQGQPSQAAAAPAATTSPYKDGVYTGTGWSRHGSVSVTMTMKSGKITSIVVTGCTTHYPCADVAPMPGEVLAAQSLQVDIVSGATDSSIAFLGAVQQALGTAQAAKG